MTGIPIKTMPRGEKGTHRGRIMWWYSEKVAINKPRRELQKGPTLPTSWSWTLSPYCCETINLLFKPPHLCFLFFFYGNPRKLYKLQTRLSWLSIYIAMLILYFLPVSRLQAFFKSTSVEYLLHSLRVCLQSTKRSETSITFHLYIINSNQGHRKAQW